MSYYVEISFKQIKSEDIIPFFKEFKEAYIKKIPDIAKEKCMFCPVVAENLHFPTSLGELRKDKFETLNCLNWANNCSRFKYFYDKEFDLLGIVGIPECLDEMFDTTIVFQNSSDQDYDRNMWSKIKAFEDIYNKWITKDVDEIKDSYNLEDDYFDFDKDYPEPIERGEKLMYWRQTFAYREIWGRYEQEIFDDNAIYFCLFGAYESSNLYKILQCCLEEATKTAKQLLEI